MIAYKHVLIFNANRADLGYLPMLTDMSDNSIVTIDKQHHRYIRMCHSCNHLDTMKELIVLFDMFPVDLNRVNNSKSIGCNR
jgi:hypothetical protein